MNKLLNKTKEFIFAQQTSMFSSTLILSGMMVISRLAGVIRDRILTGYFTTNELDMYLAAFRIPDLIFEILISGALSTTFIPFYIKYQRNTEEQGNIISSIINIISITLLLLITVLSFLIPYLVPLLTPGFPPAKTQQIVYFSQLLLIGQLPFLVFGNFLTGISQAKKSFLIPALAPLLYPFSVIIFTLLFHTQFYIMAPIVGVIVGALLFFIVQLPILYTSNFHYKFVINNVEKVWRFFRTAIPRIFTIVSAQIDATIDLSLATLLGSGSYTVFYFAQKLQLFPVSLIGIAFGQASFPYLTEMYQNDKIKEFKKVIEESILNVLYLTLPIASFLIITRTPIVRLFYGGQKFDWDATVLTAVTLSYFSISLPFHSIYYFITRCFYAIFDTKTPFYISIFSVTLNTIMSISFILIFKLPVWAMALSFSASMSISVLVLLYILHKRISGFNIQFVMYEISKILVATFNSALITYGALKLLDGLIFDTSRTINVFFLLTVCCLIYALIYFFLTWLFDIKEIVVITKMILKFKEYQRKIFEMYKGVE